jgi:hypothetical protein
VCAVNAARAEMPKPSVWWAMAARTVCHGSTGVTGLS